MSIPLHRGSAHRDHVIPGMSESLPSVMREGIEALGGGTCAGGGEAGRTARGQSGNRSAPPGNDGWIVAIGEESRVVIEHEADKVLRGALAQRLGVTRTYTSAIAIPRALPLRGRLNHLRAKSKDNCSQHCLIGHGTGHKIKGTLRWSVSAICRFEVGRECTGTYPDRRELRERSHNSLRVRLL